MGRQHIKGDLIIVVQEKTDARLAIPIHPKLKAALDTLSKEGLNFLSTEYGHPCSAKGVGNWFSERARMAGLKARTAHGLRKSAARRLAEAGCSAHEIASITGHENLKEVERYTRSASQVTLARRAIKAIS